LTCRDTAAAVLTIDHQTKDSDSKGRWAIGAQHQLAGIHVAYSIRTDKPFGRGLNGSSHIKIEKDRPGHVRRQATNGEVAKLKFKSDLDSGAVTIDLDAGTESEGPTEIMEAISVWLQQAAPKALTQKAIFD
jgi:hypothetical protein